MRPRILVPLLFLFLSLSSTAAVGFREASGLYDFASIPTQQQKTSSNTGTSRTSSSSSSGSAPVNAPSTAPKISSNSPSPGGPPNTDGSILSSVTSLCNHTQYSDVCLSIVRSLLPTSSSLNATGLVSLHLQVIKQKLQAAMDKASKLLNGPSGNAMEGTLNLCITNYQNSLNDNDNIVNALKKGNKGYFDMALSAYITNYCECDESFVEDFLSNRLASENEELRKMTSNCLALTGLAIPQSSVDY